MFWVKTMSNSLENRFGNTIFTPPSHALWGIRLASLTANITTMKDSLLVNRNAIWAQNLHTWTMDPPFVFLHVYQRFWGEHHWGYRNPQKLDFQWLQLHEISMPEGPQICIYTDAALIVTEIFVDALLGHSSSWLQSSPIPIQCFCSNSGFPWPQWSYNQWPSPTDLWSSGYMALRRT